MEMKQSEKEKTEAVIADGFAKWLEKREVKMLLSMLPSSEMPDLVQTILRSAFEAGFDGGRGSVAVMLIESMLKAKPDSGAPPRFHRS